jgi:hypothetical protein
MSSYWIRKVTMISYWNSSTTNHTCSNTTQVYLTNQITLTYRSFTTRVSQLKIWHFWVIGIERNVCRCTVNSYNVLTQFAKLAAGEQSCRCRTHRKLQHFKTFKIFSWKVTNFELWHCCLKCAIYATCFDLYLGHPQTGQYKNIHRRIK